MYHFQGSNAEEKEADKLSVADAEAVEESEEEEEEEEDLVDPKDVLEEECKNSKACAPLKHHYDECVERVTSGHGVENEDCVEEFFHLLHCASTCAAPKLWKALK